MYNVDEIVARLQNGEKLEDIGNELANAMNAAQEKYVAIQKAEEEKRAAEAEKAQRIAARRELLRDVLDAIRQYANHTDYSTIVNDWLTKATDEDVVELDEQMIELLKTFEMLSQLNFDFNVKPAVQKDTKKVAAVDPSKALGDFLKMMGW